jgi:hypothetical protein
MSSDEVFLDSLDHHRQHALGIIEGLSELQLRGPCVPSGWSPLGMILHLAASEHYWFHCMFAGLPANFHGHRTSALDLWNVTERDSVDGIFDLYRHQIEESNQIVRSNSLDSPLKVRDPAWGDWDIATLREVLAQVIGHTATHAGHLDVAREFLDGRQWMVL